MTQDHIATWHARLCLIGDRKTADAEISVCWMLQNGWRDIVILKNWEDRAVSGKGDLDEADGPAPPATASPEAAPLSRLQASVDIRRHIFERFNRDRP
jgi:hypothetical protein